MQRTQQWVWIFWRTSQKDTDTDAIVDNDGPHGRPCCLSMIMATMSPSISLTMKQDLRHRPIKAILTTSSVIIKNLEQLVDNLSKKITALERRICTRRRDEQSWPHCITCRLHVVRYFKVLFCSDSSQNQVDYFFARYPGPRLVLDRFCSANACGIFIINIRHCLLL